jgi:hypothetical protein
MPQSKRRATHVIPVGAAHLQRAVPPFMDAGGVSIADDVSKRMAPGPVASAAPVVAHHFPGRREIVPAAHELYMVSRRVVPSKIRLWI